MLSRSSRVLTVALAAAALSLPSPPSATAAETCEARSIMGEGGCPLDQDPYYTCYQAFPECGLPTDGECQDYGSGSVEWNEIWCFWNW